MQSRRRALITRLTTPLRSVFVPLFLFCGLAHAATVYVSSAAPGPNQDGLSWNTAFLTVQKGVDTAGAGDEVHVGTGTYKENVTLKNGVRLLGGYAGAGAAPDQRNPAATPSVLDGSNSRVLFIPADSGPATAVDGFTVMNGGGGGIYCDLRSAPAITNNVFTADSPGVNSVDYSAPRIAGNTFTTNYNGISAYNHAAPVIENNTFTGNGSWGITCDRYAAPAIRNNVIRLNGGGITCTSSSNPRITNNTIVSNDGYGLTCAGLSAPTVVNNIFAYNHIGVGAEASRPPTLRDNCVFANRDGNYSGINDLTGSNGNISKDPKLAGRYADFHIQPDSPCRDAGDNSVAQPGQTDMDGQPRIQGAKVDIGADESDGTAYPANPAVIRVNPTGSDANDGSSWTAAKATVQAGVNAASVYGGEVWVSAGDYTRESISLRSGVALYGGFAGTETARDARNWAVNVTQIRTVNVDFNASPATAVDGFATLNGGITCDNGSAPVILHNTIAGGVSCNPLSAPVIANNVLNGDGITCSDQSRPRIVNNTVTGAYYGLVFSGGALAVVANNIFAFNTTGVYAYSTSTGLAFSHNCVYGNGTNYSNLPDMSGFQGNISTDPLLANDYANFHIQSNSPCRDAGEDALAPGSTDMDGQARLMGAHVDIGADESAGENYSTTPVIVRVDLNAGDEANDGSSWAKAKRYIRSAIYAVSVTGGEVWVSGGVSGESVDLRSGVALYGGFDGTETERRPVHRAAHPTILTNFLDVDAGAVSGTAVDGFVFQNAGIRCGTSSAPSISNNVMSGYSAGVICDDRSTPLILNNTIVGGSGVEANEAAAPTVDNNIIAFSQGYGVYAGTGAVTLSHNCVYGSLVSNYYNVNDPTGTNGNISADPRLANNALNLHIQPDSPCRDAGDNAATPAGTLDMDGQPRVQGAGVDIGADESDGTAYPAAPGIVVRVSPAGDDANDGSSWDKAVKTIARAVSVMAANGPGEVWVAAGTYTDNVVLGDGESLYGGFAGTETTRAQRDPATNASVFDSPYSGVTVLAAARNGVTLDGFTFRNLNAHYYYYYTVVDCQRLSSPVISNNTFTGDGDSFFGGNIIDCEADSAPSITGNAFMGIHSYSSVILCSHSASTLMGNSFSANQSTRGTVVCDSASPAILQNTMGGNANYNGVVYCTGSSSPLVSGNTITGNAGLNNGGGGGVYCDSGTSPLISGNAFTNNATFNAGGAVFCAGFSTPIISGNTITGNTAGSGGGVYCSSDSMPLITGNVLTSNTASNEGGGLSAYSAFPTLLNNQFVKNTAGYAGGVSLYYCFASVRDNLISGNAATIGAGGGLSLTSTVAAVSGNTLAANTSTMDGGGVYSGGGSVTFSNNIVAFGSSGINAGGGPLVFRSNDVFGNGGNDYIALPDQTGMAGNLNADPLFVDRAAGNFHLMPASPCVDTGNDADVQPGDTDLDSQPRILGQHTDIGVDELGQGYTLDDAARALRLAAGLTAATPVDLARFNVEKGGASSTVITMSDALRLLRKAAGKDANP